MLDIYLPLANLLVVAFLFGGMLLFSGGFAAFLFRYLPPQDARMLIRKAFPLFYLFCNFLFRFIRFAVFAIGYFQCRFYGFRDVEHSRCSAIIDASDKPCH